MHAFYHNSYNIRNYENVLVLKSIPINKLKSLYYVKSKRFRPRMD